MPDDIDEPEPPRQSWVMFVPAVVGVLLVAGGLAWVWPPLGVIALGAAFLLLDRRLG